MQKNRSVPDVQRKRSQWIETISGANAEHQIYLDESGINTNLTRHYAHAVHGKRAMDATPINTPAGTTVLSSIRLNGSLVYTTYQGGTTAQRFREYIGKQLIPSLEKDDVVIMDNMRSHHAKIVTELLDKAGISYLYLPPYSPDLNPIEKNVVKNEILSPKEESSCCCWTTWGCKSGLRNNKHEWLQRVFPRIWNLR